MVALPEAAEIGCLSRGRDVLEVVVLPKDSVLVKGVAIALPLLPFGLVDCEELLDLRAAADGFVDGDDGSINFVVGERRILFSCSCCSTVPRLLPYLQISWRELMVGFR